MFRYQWFDNYCFLTINVPKETKTMKKAMTNPCMYDCQSLCSIN